MVDGGLGLLMLDSLFYGSPLKIPGKLQRGGCPVLFPQFADRGPHKKHGYARDHEFATVLDLTRPDGRELVQELQVNQGDWPAWPHSALLRLKQLFGAGSYSCTFEVVNTGGSSFEWTGGLHPYFAVSNLLQTKILGLNQGSACAKHGTFVHFLADGALSFDGSEFECLFSASDVVTIHDEALGRRLRLKSLGFSDWMVWNPGAALGDALGDIPPGDWRNFVCVEPAQVKTAVHLKPGAAFLGGFDVLVD